MADVMKMKVETGTVSVEVEDERGQVLGRFDFNPADSNILKRYGAVVDFFNAVVLDDTVDEQQQLEQMTKLADDIAGQFDYLLGGEVSQGLFGRCGPLTVTKSGEFYFEQVLDGVGRLIEQVTKKRLDKKLARIKKAAAAAPSARRG